MVDRAGAGSDSGVSVAVVALVFAVENDFTANSPGVV